MSEDEATGCNAKDSDGEGALAQIVATVPEGWRAKLAKVTLQLLVGTEQGAKMYSTVKERVDYVEGRSLISRRIAETVAEQVVKDPEVVERAKARFLNDILQKQENLEAVISRSVDYLPALPPPEHVEAAPNDDQSAGVAGMVSDGEPTPLNPDWAASFTTFAETASSEVLRDRLSRILAGEISRPGAFSRSAVRALVELEQSDLQAMQAVLPFVLKDAIYPTPKPDRRPTVGELIHLADAGLVLDPNASLQRYWSLDAGHPTPSAAGVLGSEFGLAVMMHPGGRMQHDMIPLTKAGQAVVELLGRPDERMILRTIAERAQKQNVISIKLGRVLGSVINVEEHLFPSPDASLTVPASVIPPDA